MSISSISSPISSKKMDCNTHRIYWQWIDEGGFPKKVQSEEEKMEYQPIIIREFETTLLNAEERIWIIDPHFSEQYGLSAIWLSLCFTNARDIRVISHLPVNQNWIYEKITETGYKPKSEIEWKVCFMENHDRFAIVDQILWHFGSTVGGGYPKFGAITSGWDSGELSKIFLAKWGSN